MNVYGVIMAGGEGARFWPLSRKETPKQFLNLSGNGLLINETIERISGIINKKDIFIVTGESQMAGMRRLIDQDILPDHILYEPTARNTSACIGYAATTLVKRYGDGIMCVLPADHHIEDLDEFYKSLKIAINEARAENILATIGIKPHFPATGYGYIRMKNKECVDTSYIVNKSNEITATYEADNPRRMNITDRTDDSSEINTTYKLNTSYEVLEFVEKPDIETAKEYISSKQYVWNSGMFVWKASTILKSMQRYIPHVYHYLEEIGKALSMPNKQSIIKEIYPKIPKVSIDYGVLEKSDNIVVIPGGFKWSDIGSWDMLGTFYNPDENGNIIKGEVVTVNAEGCIIYSEKRLIAATDIKNIIIVETKDAILVCDKSKAQDVKLVVEKLREQGKDWYI